MGRRRGEMEAFWLMGQLSEGGVFFEHLELLWFQAS